MRGRCYNIRYSHLKENHMDKSEFNKGITPVLFLFTTVILIIVGVLVNSSVTANQIAKLGPHSSFTWTSSYQAKLIGSNYVLVNKNNDYFELGQDGQPPIPSHYQAPAQGETTGTRVIEQFINGGVYTISSSATIYSLEPVTVVFSLQPFPKTLLTVITAIVCFILWLIVMVALAYYDDH